jgi:hypothetical protein
MPCNSDYLEASPREWALGMVLAIHDELDGKPADYGSVGYRRDVYNKGRDDLNEQVVRLCARLSEMTPEAVRALSLEAQIWWRNHRRADAERKRVEEAERKRAEARERALAKLTPEEADALGVRRPRKP